MTRRSIASCLALFLGTLGIHEFYMNRPGRGILYAVFSVTFIPTILALIQAIKYATQTDEAFNAAHPDKSNA